MHCPTCGRVISDNARFCPHCGALIPAAARQTNGDPVACQGTWAQPTGGAGATQPAAWADAQANANETRSAFPGWPATASDRPKPVSGRPAPRQPAPAYPPPASRAYQPPAQQPPAPSAQAAARPEFVSQLSPTQLPTPGSAPHKKLRRLSGRTIALIAGSASIALIAVAITLLVLAPWNADAIARHARVTAPATQRAAANASARQATPFSPGFRGSFSYTATDQDGTPLEDPTRGFSIQQGAGVVRVRLFGMEISGGLASAEVLSDGTRVFTMKDPSAGEGDSGWGALDLPVVRVLMPNQVHDGDPTGTWGVVIRGLANGQGPYEKGTPIIYSVRVQVGPDGTGTVGAASAGTSDVQAAGSSRDLSVLDWADPTSSQYSLSGALAESVAPERGARVLLDTIGTRPGDNGSSVVLGNYSIGGRKQAGRISVSSAG